LKSSNKNRKQSFLEGAAVLVIATALVKVFGAIFKIPLQNNISGLAVGYFNTAYDLYLPIYSVALAGMPVAVCRMVASHMEQKQYADARQVLSVARKVFWLIGIVGTLVVWLVAKPYLSYVGESMGTFPSLIVIAPCVLFCCIMSTYRGYYEGLSNMTPTAFSQVIEALLGKVVLGLGCAFLVKHLGYGAEIQAAAAIFGIMLGTAFGALYLRLRYHFSGDGITPQQLVMCGPAVNTKKQTLKALITIAVPVILGSLASQVAGLVDVMTVQRQLSNIVNGNPDFFEQNFGAMWQELSADPDVNSYEALLAAIPTYLYGCYKGFAFTIYSLVPTITSVIGVSALPAMTTAFTSGDKTRTKLTLESAIRITSLITLPAGFGIAAVSEGILNLLYSEQPVSASIAAAPLTVLGFAVIFGGLAMPMTNLLQAIGKERIPVINMLIGALIKIVLNYFLVGTQEINIVGAAISTLVCYGFICTSDYIFLVKYTGVRPNFMATFVKPLIASALCGMSAWAAYGLLGRVAPGSLATIGAIMIAAFVYLLAVLLLRIITKNDVFMLPKGEKIAKVLEKFHFIG
jgi:stage V sporulation protein B